MSRPSTQQSIAVDRSPASRDAVSPFFGPSAAAEIVRDMEAAPPPAFYRGLSWAMLPATGLWAIVILGIRFLS